MCVCKKNDYSCEKKNDRRICQNIKLSIKSGMFQFRNKISIIYYVVPYFEIIPVIIIRKLSTNLTELEKYYK